MTVPSPQEILCHNFLVLHNISILRYNNKNNMVWQKIIYLCRPFATPSPTYLISYGGEEVGLREARAQALQHEVPEVGGQVGLVVEAGVGAVGGGQAGEALGLPQEGREEHEGDAVQVAGAGLPFARGDVVTGGGGEVFFVTWYKQIRVLCLGICMFSCGKKYQFEGIPITFNIQINIEWNVSLIMKG